MGCCLNRFKLVCTLVQPACQTKLWSILSHAQILRAYPNTSVLPFWLKENLCSLYFGKQFTNYSRVIISSQTIWDRIFGGKFNMYTFCFTADLYGQECLLLLHFTVIPARLVILNLTVVFPRWIILKGSPGSSETTFIFISQKNSGRLQ